LAGGLGEVPGDPRLISLIRRWLKATVLTICGRLTPRVRRVNDALGAAKCSTLLSGPASRRVLFRPCASLSLHVHHVVKRTFTSKRSNIARHTKQKAGTGKCPPRFRYEERSLEGRLYSELERTWCADGKHARTEANEASTILLRCSVDRGCGAIQRSCQQRVRAVVILPVKEVIECHLRLDNEAVRVTNWPNGPAKAQVEGKECVVSHLARRC